MEKLARNKVKFIGMSCLSLACLIGSFAHPLQKLEVWKQVETGAFNLNYERYFILTENDRNHPYGFNKYKSTKVSQIYQDYKVEKIGLLVLAIATASTALSLGRETCIGDEIDTEVEYIKAEGKKQLILEGIKHRLAMASKSQRLLFMDEMKALIEEFGSPEGEILEGDEVNATDKFTNAGYLLSEGHPIDVVVTQTWGYKPGTSEHTEMKQKFEDWQASDDEPTGLVATSRPERAEVDVSAFRQVFPESLDSTTWKAICKALGEGVSRADIVKDVLGCSSGQTGLGDAYFDFLKSRFLDG